MTRALYLMITLVVVALDMATKAIILRTFRIHEAMVVIPDFFQIVHVRNTGAAFGIGANTGSPLVPIILGVAALVVFAIVVFYSFRAELSDRVLQVGLHLILGGAIGNLIDRFRLGSVVDFLDFFVVVGGQEYHWPAFNVADMAVCIGIGLLFIDMWRKPKPVEESA